MSVLSVLILSKQLWHSSDNMNEYKTPPSLQTKRQDYSQKGIYADPHSFHRLWFEFLLLSPSYELARRYRADSGKLSADDRARLPADFDKVLEVFDDFGDLQRSFFRPWLQARGLRLFGIPGDRPTTKLLHKLDGSGDQPEIQTIKSVERYLASGWKKQSRPEVLLLSVPLNIPRQAAFKELKKILDDHLAGSELPEVAKYKLASKGMHRQNVVDALTVLFVRAARPDFKLWQVGVEAKVSETYSKLFDWKTSKRTANNATDFRILEMMTSRKLRLAKHLIENAARGRFPAQDEPQHMVDFDPKEFSAIISARNQWIQQEYKKIKSTAGT